MLLCFGMPALAQKNKQGKKVVEKKQPDKQPEKKEPEQKQTVKEPEKKEAGEKYTSLNVCNCVSMKIQAQDTLGNDAYITYTFTLKNRCKEPVWVNSGRFGFFVNNFNGGRPRVLRELLFVKRAIYPPFVLIKPGSDFDFKFADNPFDEYQLKRGNRYWFRFTYNNTTLRQPSGKNLNYLCKKELQRLVYIK